MSNLNNLSKQELISLISELQAKLDKPKRKKRDKAIPEVLSVDEVNAILDTPKPQHHAVILQLMYGCGLRVSEALALQKDNINLSGMELKVVKGKGGKDRIVTLDEKTADTLRKYFLSLNGQSKLFSISRQSVFKMVRKYAKKCGICKKVHPHTFRHCIATHLLNNGAKLEKIQEFLGHSNIQTTRIYTDISKEELKKEMAKYHPGNKNNGSVK